MYLSPVKSVTVVFIISYFTVLCNKYDSCRQRTGLLIGCIKSSRTKGKTLRENPKAFLLVAEAGFDSRGRLRRPLRRLRPAFFASPPKSGRRFPSETAKNACLGVQSEDLPWSDVYRRVKGLARLRTGGGAEKCPTGTFLNTRPSSPFPLPKKKVTTTKPC